MYNNISSPVVYYFVDHDEDDADSDTTDVVWEIPAGLRRWSRELEVGNIPTASDMMWMWLNTNCLYDDLVVDKRGRYLSGLFSCIKTRTRDGTLTQDCYHYDTIVPDIALGGDDEFTSVLEGLINEYIYKVFTTWNVFDKKIAAAA